jgi:hypothetical protein
VKLNSDIGGIIWLIIIAIGAISSMVKKAKQAQAARPVDPQAAAQAAAARAAAIAAQRARLAQVAAQVTPTVQNTPILPSVPPRPAVVNRPAPMRPAAPPVRSAQTEPITLVATIDPFASTAMPFDAPTPPPPIVHDNDMGLTTGVPKRFFENRQSLIWAVVMSEVLGRPKALAVEQNLWSPSNQPPST